jgi:hypothetical protein
VALLCFAHSFLFSVSKDQSLALFRQAVNGNIDVPACLMGAYTQDQKYCGVIQYYILMIVTALIIPLLCGLFTVLFYCCRCCPCCKYKCCCNNCGGKQPLNQKNADGVWVSGPYTKCEKSFWYTSHAVVVGVLLLLSIGGGYSVSAIPDNIAVIFDAVVYVMEIPGKFFDEVATPAISVALTSMADEVDTINTQYSTAALAVKGAASALASACTSGSCCEYMQSTFANIRDLDALTKTFDRNAFNGFLNATLNDKLKEGKDVIKNANIPVNDVKALKEFPKMVPAGAGFVLFVPVFLPILINLLAFFCKKQCPFWCSHLCAFLFSGLVFLIFIVIFLVGSVLSETCTFLPAPTTDAVDVSGIEAIFPPKEGANSSSITNLFKHCLAKKSGGSMFDAVSFDISGQIKSIVEENINKDVLGIDSNAQSKIAPINQTIIDMCNSTTTQRGNLVSLQSAQAKLNSVVGNIDVTTRAGVSKVLLGFANQISSCDVIATGYLGLRSSICGGFSDSIIATYFSLYGCGIFLILFLITTMKIVKKVSRSSAVHPADQAPKVAGAPDAASAMAPSKAGASTAKAPQASTKADQKQVQKPN